MPHPAISPERAREMGLKSAQARRLQSVERRIRELNESVPALTDEQRDRLALLLRPSA